MISPLTLRSLLLLPEIYFVAQVGNQLLERERRCEEIAQRGFEVSVVGGRIHSRVRKECNYQ